MNCQRIESTSSTNARAAKRKKKDTLRRILGDVGVILHEDQPGIPVELGTVYQFL